jgi:hypothetical protein
VAVCRGGDRMFSRSSPLFVCLSRGVAEITAPPSNQPTGLRREPGFQRKQHGVRLAAPGGMGQQGFRPEWPGGDVPNQTSSWYATSHTMWAPVHAVPGTWRGLEKAYPSFYLDNLLLMAYRSSFPPAGRGVRMAAVYQMLGERKRCA